MGWEEDAPPLPARNYSWSDIEDDIDDEVLQSDDDLDEPISHMSITEHQQIYSSVSISWCIYCVYFTGYSQMCLVCIVCVADNALGIVTVSSMYCVPNG